MRILAFDTSTELCSVALGDGETWRERVEVAGQRHSELLLPAVDALLGAAGVTLAQLDGIAFGAGPGSFTGLRIACGVAQGLALGSGRLLVGVSTLEAIAEAAWQHHGASRVVAALDARMHEVYIAAYERIGASWSVHREPMVVRPGDAPLPRGDGWAACGPGFAAYPVLRERFLPILASTFAETMPSAIGIGRIAVPLFVAGLGVDASAAAPIYLRHRVALTTAERNAGARQ